MDVNSYNSSEIEDLFKLYRCLHYLKILRSNVDGDSIYMYSETHNELLALPNNFVLPNMSLDLLIRVPIMKDSGISSTSSNENIADIAKENKEFISFNSDSILNAENYINNNEFLGNDENVDFVSSDLLNVNINKKLTPKNISNNLDQNDLLINNLNVCVSKTNNCVDNLNTSTNLIDTEKKLKLINNEPDLLPQNSTIFPILSSQNNYLQYIDSQTANENMEKIIHDNEKSKFTKTDNGNCTSEKLGENKLFSDENVTIFNKAELVNNETNYSFGINSNYDEIKKMNDDTYEYHFQNNIISDSKYPLNHKCKTSINFNVNNTNNENMKEVTYLVKKDSYNQPSCNPLNNYEYKFLSTCNSNDNLDNYNYINGSTKFSKLNNEETDFLNNKNESIKIEVTPTFVDNDLFNFKEAKPTSSFNNFDNTNLNSYLNNSNFKKQKNNQFFSKSLNNTEDFISTCSDNTSDSSALDQFEINNFLRITSNNEAISLAALIFSKTDMKWFAHLKNKDFLTISCFKNGFLPLSLSFLKIKDFKVFNSPNTKSMQEQTDFINLIYNSDNEINSYKTTRIIILPNNGIIFVAKTIDELFHYIHHANLLAKLQVKCMPFLNELSLLPLIDQKSDKYSKFNCIYSEFRKLNLFLDFEAMNLNYCMNSKSNTDYNRYPLKYQKSIYYDARETPLKDDLNNNSFEFSDIIDINNKSSNFDSDIDFLDIHFNDSPKNDILNSSNIPKSESTREVTLSSEYRTCLEKLSDICRRGALFLGDPSQRRNNRRLKKSNNRTSSMTSGVERAIIKKQLEKNSIINT